MRHRVVKRHFNRRANPRQALLRGLLRNLVERGTVTTTEIKGKELARLFDIQMSRAKKGTLHDRRLLHEAFGKRDVVNTLVDQIAAESGERTSGFTTISVVGRRRGDNALLVKVSLVNMPEHIGQLKAPADSVKTKKKSVVKPKATPVKKAKPATKKPAPAKKPTEGKPATKKTSKKK